MNNPHLTLNTAAKIKPISVKVHWSESREFSENTHYDFMDFERKALEVAKTNPRGGYDKTKVTVLFDNDDTHECRLDLGCGGNDAGFTEHCLSTLAYYLRHQYDADKPWLHDPHHLSLIKAIQSYELDKAFAENARQEVQRAEMAAKAEDEAIARAEQQEREQQHREHQEKEQAFQASLTIPEWAKAVIVATYTDYDAENSDPHTGYHATKAVRTFILAWSRHNRNLFPELRKACLNHPSTAFLNDPEKNNEHRETHWSGDGYYLTDTKYLRYGWSVRKHVFYNETQKAKYVPLGELVIPD
ncbi:hypothetical protein VH1709_contig00043-0117 [Vibrio harveyi]|uniref:LPD25 domain-containing protein n=1 Tax=Vibrio harveyi TaxID=669 RepID=UPI00067FB54C|nr:LPD25 domain-containing protein [Vibrio harveyi]EKO3838456.1 hypothetical protein [Vibrio harveyi]GBL00059.1 hypothetical protein VH1709_contig00043-0117 [Vibrio harveyi]